MKTPLLVCILCGLIVLDDDAIDDGGYSYPSKCIANAGADHIDPKRLTGVEIEAVQAMRRKWLNP